MLAAALPDAGAHERPTVVDRILQQLVFRKRCFHPIPGVEGKHPHDLFARAPEGVKRMGDASPASLRIDSAASPPWLSKTRVAWRIFWRPNSTLRSRRLAVEPSLTESSELICDIATN